MLPTFHKLMARPTTTTPLGKCDDRLDITVPSQLKEHLSALAIASGYGSCNEFVRAVLIELCYGKVAAMQAAYGRVRPSTTGISPEE